MASTPVLGVPWSYWDPSCRPGGTLITLVSPGCVARKRCSLPENSRIATWPRLSVEQLSPFVVRRRGPCARNSSPPISIAIAWRDPDLFANRRRPAVDGRDPREARGEVRCVARVDRSVRRSREAVCSSIGVAFHGADTRRALSSFAIRRRAERARASPPPIRSALRGAMRISSLYCRALVRASKTDR